MSPDIAGASVQEIVQVANNFPKRRVVSDRKMAVHEAVASISKVPCIMHGHKTNESSTATKNCRACERKQHVLEVKLRSP